MEAREPQDRTWWCTVKEKVFLTTLQFVEADTPTEAAAKAAGDDDGDVMVYGPLELGEGQLFSVLKQVAAKSH